MNAKESKTESPTPSPEALKALAAANRVAEKLRKRKRAFGQKIIVWEDQQVLSIDP